MLLLLLGAVACSTGGIETKEVVANGVSASPNVFNTSDSRFTEGVENQGWWSPVLTNADWYDNYVVGSANGDIDEFRTFFSFDLSSLDLTAHTIEKAYLQVDEGTCGSGGAPRVGLFDVSTGAATLNFNVGPSQEIFDDLGSGTSFGIIEAEDFIASKGTLTAPLNADALAAIAAAAGGFFSIGAALLDRTPGAPQTAFDCASSAGVQRLALCYAGDPDTDEDTFCNGVDNCPTTGNENQQDGDTDGVGDVCDNCSHELNPSQENQDGDTRGDGCDNCPAVASDDFSDADFDSLGAPCDNCPTAWNSDQTDTDGDGTGDACEDFDGDGAFDTIDNCSTLPNADQLDSDADSVGDVCDPTPTHDLAVLAIDARTFNLNRNAAKTFVTFPIQVKVKNFANHTDQAEVLIFAQSNPPTGCEYLESGIRTVIPVRSLRTETVTFDLQIACGPAAVPSTTTLTVMAQTNLIFHNGFETNLSNNQLFQNVQIRVR